MATTSIQKLIQKMKVYGSSSDYCVEKILIAAKYVDVQVDMVEAKNTDLSPGGKLPVLQVESGESIGQSNAIVRFIASMRSDLGLAGKTTYQMALVDQWLDFSWNELEVPAAVLLDAENLKKSIKAFQQCHALAVKDTTNALTILDAHLKDKCYMVGEHVTIADIAIVCVLRRLFEATDMKSVIEELENLNRFYNTCINKDQFLVCSTAGVATTASVCNSSSQPKKTGNVLEDLTATTAPADSLQTPVIKERFSRHRLRIKELLKGGESLIDQTVVIKGWAKTLREAGAGAFAFLELNDGSCFTGAQVLVTKGETEGFEDVIASGGAGASFGVTGIVVKSPAKGQTIEIKATKVVVLGVVEDKAKYPMSKKRHTLEHLRHHAHLRPRSNIHGAAMRVRNAMAFACHKFFNDRGFLYIHTPLITASDCEGAGEMFSVTTLLTSHPDGNLPKTKDGKAVDYSKDFFDKPAFLTVSGQLNVETHACALSDVYTFGPTFRAENSNTTRHLAEFWMIEPEISFADLTDDIDLAEDMLKYCAQYALDNCGDDIAFFDKNVEKGLIARLEKVISEDFIRLTYTDAVALLQEKKNLKKGKFQVKPEWGVDLGSEHERFLTEVIYKKPVCIYNYPKEIKAFYMRLNDDNKTVAAVDVLVPKIGEIIGGSQREERLDVLNRRIVEATGHPPEAYEWYTDLRKYGSVPHAGFGLGFERLVRFVTGIENIRDVIPFPRWPGNADF